MQTELISLTAAAMGLWWTASCRDILCFISWQVIQAGIKWEWALLTTCRKASRFAAAQGQQAFLNLLLISLLHKEAKDHKAVVFSLTEVLGAYMYYQ